MSKQAEIETLQIEIADCERELIEVQKRKKEELSGLDGRKVGAIKRGLMKKIKECRFEIKKAKLRKPKKSTDGELVKIEVPGTERIVRTYSGRPINEIYINEYLDDLPEMSIDGDEHREFENCIVKLACRTIFCPLKSLAAEYPELLMDRKDEAFEYDHPEETQILLKTKGEIYGLSVHGRGYRYSAKPGTGKLAGATLRPTESFDNTERGINNGKGWPSGSRGFDAPDFDPSDDSGEG
jgi:hypothetical protein